MVWTLLVSLLNPTKEDASDLRAAISMANRKRSTPKSYNRPDNQYGSVNRGSGSAKFNPRSFFCCCSSCGNSFVGIDPRNKSLLVTVKTSSDGLDATGFTVKSHFAELAKAAKKNSLD
jgi:hypothetical protein